MRGKHGFELDRPKPYRITPADAGKTAPPSLCRWCSGDHPRGCGENRNALLPVVFAIGSPPRMRGKLYRFLSSALQRKDHPRGCGENKSISHGLSFVLGSPPRMRGKLSAGTLFSAASRITPADAGKTVLAKSEQILNEDHPRGCGENCCFATANPYHIGSPPRMRGKPAWRSCMSASRRITPADAGKTPPRATS